MRRRYQLILRCAVYTSRLWNVFFNDTATTEIYTLSLHDALPISLLSTSACVSGSSALSSFSCAREKEERDRKSTRLNSSHTVSSHAVFCLKKNQHRNLRRNFLHCRTAHA